MPADASTVVDLGSGRGTFSELLRQRGVPVTCVEPDTENQQLLCDLGFTVDAGVDTLRAGSVDFVFTLNVLEHVPEDDILVRQVLTCLRPGGRLFIFVPAFPVLWSPLDDYVEHQRRYRRAPMVEMLERSGFRVESARYADSLGFFAALLFGRSSQTEITPRSISLYDRLLTPASQALDPVLGRFFGKNLAVLCRKPL